MSSPSSRSGGPMSASGGRRGRRALASLSLLFGTAALVAAPHARAAYPVTLADAATGMSSPIGIDYYPTTHSALVSVNYDGGGFPYNFETVDSAGAHSQFSSIAR